VKISVPYGYQKICFSLPEENLAEILAPKIVVISKSEEEEISEAINNPIGTRKLIEMVRPSDKIVILCEDISRFAHTDKILMYLLNYLNKYGIENKNISIIIALGSHRPMTKKEIKKKVGEEVFARIKVKNSEFKDKKNLVNMGFAPGNVKMWIDRRVINADIKIGVGSIIPHPALGYTGGGKIIFPGVAGEETVAQLHLRSALLEENIMGWADNPIRKEMEEWVKTIGLDFIINAVVTPENKTYKIIAGDFVEAHRRGVIYAQEIYEIIAREKVDVAIVSSHTADWDLWQGAKGVIAGERIVKNEGTLILLAPCFEGIGPHSSYIDYIGSDSCEKFIREAWEGKMDKKEILPLSVGALIARIRKRIKLSLISDGITYEDAKRAKFDYFENIEEALDNVFQQYGEGIRISVMPYGGDSYSYIKKKVF
jgi:nickel-dependent lactate racemase